ncbi:hypothetical protein ABL78_3352 [Leptomonas seymouri]|uniref:Uncharacterized protein n=1 Tax=Leptomonas seymouri TaxID=5684 RepID=A0A0N1ILD1_LEPSE|nr:hypothetical protein ABL78_3352 [Leptomonas seymouri]|eukprot:KPI87555.1 hypothetical protein ABL78_3352 [Leptomonas seymouri]
MSLKAEPAAEQADGKGQDYLDVLPLPTHTPQATEDDDGAIEIIDNEGEDEAVLEASYDAGALLGTANVLTGGEEAPPRLTRDYAVAFFNSDPRIAFDALHIGALRTIEACERMTRSNYDYPPWYVPQAEYVAPPCSSSSERAFFTVGAMHPIVQSRAPVEREDRRVDELLSHASRQTLAAAIGPDMVERLRMHRSGETRRRRRRESPGQPKKRVMTSSSPGAESS